MNTEQQKPHEIKNRPISTNPSEKSNKIRGLSQPEGQLEDQDGDKATAVDAEATPDASEPAAAAVAASSSAAAAFLGFLVLGSPDRIREAKLRYFEIKIKGKIRKKMGKIPLEIEGEKSKEK